MTTAKEKNGSMEGRYIAPDGTDHGDATFHEVAWNTDTDAVKEDVEALAIENVDLAEALVESYQETEQRARGYKGLLAIFPNHPNRVEWKKEVK